MKVLLPVLAAAVTLTACSAGREPAAPATVTATATVVSSPAAAPEPAPTSAPVTVTVTAQPPSPQPPVTGPCTDADLTVSNKAVESQGSEYRVVLLFENTSSRPCTLTGYPGADIVNDNGPVTHAERRPQNAAPLLTLQPGEVATADLQSRDVHPVNDGDMCPRWGSVVVIAPNTFQPRNLGIGMPLCTPLISTVT